MTKRLFYQLKKVSPLKTLEFSSSFQGARKLGIYSKPLRIQFFFPVFLFELWKGKRLEHDVDGTAKTRNTTTLCQPYILSLGSHFDRLLLDIRRRRNDSELIQLFVAGHGNYCRWLCKEKRPTTPIKTNIISEKSSCWDLNCIPPYAYQHMYRIQTDARVITGNTTEIKNRGRRPRFFISRLYFP